MRPVAVPCTALLLAVSLTTACGDADTPAATSSAPAAAAEKAPPGTVASTPSGASSTAATIGDEVITVAQVREAARSELAELRRQEYELLRGALDNLLAERLLEAEANRQGTTLEALLDAEVGAKVTPPTDADVKAFYEQYKAQIGQPFEAVTAGIQNQILRERQSELYTSYLDGLKKQAKVRIRLEPPRTEVTTDAEDPSFGPKDAPVTIVEFSDFQCGYCARVLETVGELKGRYGDKVRVVFRDFPLGFHNQAQKAAEAAQCANDQDRFWDYHDHLFANQAALGVDDLKKHAETLGLDATVFAKCLDDGKHTAEVEKDMADGVAAGVSGTPAFFINGRFLSGAAPMEQFTAIIDDELERAGS